MPDLAMVPMLAITSSRDMPMPLSDTVIVRASASTETRILRSGSSLKERPVGDGLEAETIAGIGGVRHELAKEDLLVAVQGVNHEMEKLADLGLEAQDLWPGWASYR